MKFPAVFRNILLSLALILPAFAALADAYEAKLPDELATSPKMCDYVACTEVLPGATSFSERKGQPPYVEGYVEENGEKRKIGYVMLSTDITDTPAYSGKPVVTLIGMDTAGRFTGVKVLKHSEPILLLGIPESALIGFNQQYLGKFVGDNIEIGQSRPEENIIGLDAISGATVTVIAQNQVMMTSGTNVARQVGILKPTVREPAKFVETGVKSDWATLVDEGSVQRLVVTPEQVGLPRGGKPFIDLWFGYLNQPDVGRAVLGDGPWRSLMSRLKEGEHALFVIRTGGIESFKGSGFVRGGIYDRVQVRQGADSFTFRDLDAVNLYGLAAAGAPAFNESSIFIIRSKAFSAAYPWKFVFLGNRVDRATGTRSFVNFDSEYWLPETYLEGGRPEVIKPDAPWVRVWKTRAVEIGLFAALLIAVGTLYGFRDRLTRRASRNNKWPVNIFKYSAWLISIGFVGFGLLAQPSITQVLTWFHALLFQWTWELFLTDPFIFLFWIFIIVTVFLWGRGLFCGWLCPFGSLSELLYKLGGAVGLKRFQFQLSRKWHDRLKWVKYGVFFGLLAVSFFSMGLAEKLAEIEPFKTTFLVGMFNRSWPYTLFAAGLLGLSIFIERPFCKYLCPLGASLAMPSTFRWFGLDRKQECSSCKACAVGCGAQAIDANGRIDHRECLHCLDCMVLYTDCQACPPLSQERKRRTKAGLPLTPIGADGYYVPIKPMSADKAQAA
ncbi:NosR/NirI family protein [Aromatoleum aromaticum]|uniref:NosR transcription regulator (N-terminal domain), contains 4Fe-4S cluster n=1 Tax=Aromatoleum aromaticum (strain DSM 19018 / LMG 30748 / EbN1) TaxID=76114 RepID=Q5NZ02_AROAE|nr:NosR/NirI family protein [Aromatoleum aromaticum]NMG55636.1 4Fe-4S binding protein [Aromatoleum aromaticum]CAI09712.1 NosR transcription regulator (N-terminal domain), contains 4Fe-4S cluster [Aromatoleum aromaticum EbN1]